MEEGRTCDKPRTVTHLKRDLIPPPPNTAIFQQLGTMTEVLSITQPDGNAHFAAALRRSSSQTSFVLRNPSSYSKSSPNLKSRYAAVGYDTSKFPASLPSSAPSSPRLNAPDFSNQPSYTSTPSSSLSLDDQCGAQEEEDISFPLYDDGGYFEGLLDHNPTSSPEPIDPKLVTNSPPSVSNIEPLDPPSIGGDDTAIRSEPTRHVDYLSHNWKEEDIWSSWRHIVAKRKAYSNSPRLVNASWRTWAKSMSRLKTVSPEALNWYVPDTRNRYSCGKSLTSPQDERSRRDLALWASANRQNHVARCGLGSTREPTITEQFLRLQKTHPQEAKLIGGNATTFPFVVDPDEAGYGRGPRSTA